jgi:tRNA(adenine34) deaminase
MNNDQAFMGVAIEEAVAALAVDEVPIGAVVVVDGRVIARAHNSSILLQDPTAHAEILAIRRAADHVKNYRLVGATLYVTLEPCVMCAGAIIQARIARVVFGAYDPKGGAATSLYSILHDDRLNHTAVVTGGIREEECRKILSRFFRQKRLLSPSIPS